jgi:hypothetical protein
MGRKRKQRALRFVTSVVLVLATSLGLVSAAMLGGVYRHSPTATYQGYFSISYRGVYHYLDAEPICRTNLPPCLVSSEAVFYMNTENGTIRLVFYCGKIVQDYCTNASQLPFGNGTCLHVKGTLLKPSRWPSNQFSPFIHFEGDLYVFTYEIIPSASCA